LMWPQQHLRKPGSRDPGRSFGRLLASLTRFY
jgi:hypothetical protein